MKKQQHNPSTNDTVCNKVVAIIQIQWKVQAFFIHGHLIRNSSRTSIVTYFELSIDEAQT